MTQLSEFRINSFVRKFVQEPVTSQSYYTLKCDFERFEPDEKEAILLDILFYLKLKTEKGGD